MFNNNENVYTFSQLCFVLEVEIEAKYCRISFLFSVLPLPDSPLDKNTRECSLKTEQPFTKKLLFFEIPWCLLWPSKKKVYVFLLYRYSGISRKKKCTVLRFHLLSVAGNCHIICRYYGILILKGRYFGTNYLKIP